MTNNLDILFAECLKWLDELAHYVSNKKEELDDEAEVKRYCQTHFKLSSAISIIREAYGLWDNEK